MAKIKQDTVSDNSLKRIIVPEEDLSPEGYPKNSEEAKEYEKRRQFLSEVAKPAFRVAEDSRRKYDQEWMARNLFWRGYHFSRYQPQTQTVVLSSRAAARIPINYVASNMRSIRNQVTSFRPKFEVLPVDPRSDVSKTQARYSQRILDYYFDRLKLKRKIKETVTQALMYSIGGPWQIVYDRQHKEIRIWLLDPFDWYCDPFAEEYDEAEYMIKAVRMPVNAITTNPDFDDYARLEITGGDNKIAASQYKQFMIQALKQLSPRNEDGAPMILVYEGDFKRRKDDGTVYMVKCMWTEQNTVPLLYQEEDRETFDYVVYRGDLNPKDIYGESWMKHVMPINRALNSLEASAFEYNYRVAKGRIVVDRDSGVRAIHNIHGEIISKNRGAEVKALDMAPLPVAVPQQIERLWRYNEDISGVHEASLGRIPTGVKTGVGIAELKQADATSQDDLVDNLEDFLNEVAMKMLEKIAENYSTYKVVRDLGAREGQEKAFAIIGKGFNKSRKDADGQPKKKVKIGPDILDVAEIGKDNHIRVTVGSWLGYTKEALQQKVYSMYQMQLIDQATALRLLEFGTVDEIVQQTRIEAVLKKNLGQPQDPNQPDQMGLAMTENDMLMEGKDMPVSENDDHFVHIAIHQDALGRGVADQLVLQHIQKHQLMAGSSSPNPMQGGTDFGDQARSQVVAQQQQPAQPQQPQQPPQPTGQPGQNLPQQNMPQAMMQTDNAAGAAMGGGFSGY